MLFERSAKAFSTESTIATRSSLKGLAGAHAGEPQRHNLASQQLAGRSHREEYFCEQSCAPVLIDTAKTMTVRRHGAHQRSVFAPYPEEVYLAAKTLLGPRLFLDQF